MFTVYIKGTPRRRQLPNGSAVEVEQPLSYIYEGSRIRVYRRCSQEMQNPVHRETQNPCQKSGAIAMLRCGEVGELVCGNEVGVMRKW
jgi:hypothetical protein